jgi:hypothetical protein
LSPEAAGASTTTSVDAGVSTDARDEPMLPADGVGRVLELVRPDAAGAPPPRAGESEDVAGEEALLPRPERRAGALVLVDDPVDADESALPVDPDEPVVSANANGIAARPDPTPSATASAPTRPTYLAKPGVVTESVRRVYSMDRTEPFDERRLRRTDLESGIVAPLKKIAKPLLRLRRDYA